MPSDVAPAATAVSAYSICSSFPLGEKVVSEKEYAESPITPLSALRYSPHVCPCARVLEGVDWACGRTCALNLCHGLVRSDGG
jgi:hypothetical protein